MQVEDTMKKDPLSKQLDEINLIYKSVERQINKEKETNILKEKEDILNKENKKKEGEINNFSIPFIIDNKKTKYNIDEKIFNDFIKSNIIKNKENEIDIIKSSLKDKNKIIKSQRVEINEYEKQIDEFTELLRGIKDMFSDKVNKNSLEVLEKINMNIKSIQDNKIQNLEKDKVICELQEHLIRQKLEIEKIKYLEIKVLDNSQLNNRIKELENCLYEKDNLIKTLEINLKELKINEKNSDNILEDNIISNKLGEDNIIINTLKQDNKELKKDNEMKNIMISNLQSENQILKINNNENLNEIKNMKMENLELIKENKENYKRENILKERILDLQGNIRVFLRIRESINNKKSLSYKIKNNLFNINNQGFNFDYVYSKNTKQKEVFEELELLIKSIFNGYNIIISCYGQTGSGKTYTMEGKGIENNIKEIDSECGIFPRSIHTIFNCIKEMEENGYKININFSSVEVYNDKTNFFIKSNETRKNHKNLEIIYETVKNKEDIFKKYKYSISKRKIAETNSNKTSSRSHFIIFLKIIIEKEGEKRIGQIAFIDLAGSERISKSSVTGERLKETTSINTSLLGLRNVLYALKNKNDNNNTFIPYRSCTLTHLLQPLFENKIRMVMIVNISDLETDLNETVCSLRFGEMSREVKFGKADKNIELNE